MVNYFGLSSIARLIPNTILTFVINDDHEYVGGNYLKEDLLMLIKST